MLTWLHAYPFIAKSNKIVQWNSECQLVLFKANAKEWWPASRMTSFTSYPWNDLCWNLNENQLSPSIHSFNFGHNISMRLNSTSLSLTPKNDINAKEEHTNFLDFTCKTLVAISKTHENQLYLSQSNLSVVLNYKIHQSIY